MVKQENGPAVTECGLLITASKDFMASTSIDVQSPPTTPPRRIAPLWHTVVLIVVLLGFSFLGAKAGHPVARHQGLVPQYISMIVVEWLAFAYVMWGIRKGGVLTLRQMIGGRWNKVEDFLLEIAIAAGFWIVSLLVLGGCAYVLGMTKGGANIEDARKVLGFLVPRTRLEIALWICVAATAGFCEEMIFRGYVQRQFAAISGKVLGGMLASSIIFGTSHGYEGLKRMVLISVYGFLFSTLAELRKSLRPGMMAHAWHDAFTGLVMRVLFK